MLANKALHGIAAMLRLGRKLKGRILAARGELGRYPDIRATLGRSLE